MDPEVTPPEAAMPAESPSADLATPTLDTEPNPTPDPVPEPTPEPSSSTTPPPPATVEEVPVDEDAPTEKEKKPAATSQPSKSDDDDDDASDSSSSSSSEASSGSDDKKKQSSKKSKKDKKKKKKKKSTPAVIPTTRVLRSATGKVDVKVSAARAQAQRDLIDKYSQQTHTRKRTVQDEKKDHSFAGRLGRGQIVSYKGHVPDRAPGRVHFDSSANSVLLPIGRGLVPFHLATMKTVSATDQGADVVVRVNFHVPTGTANAYIPGLMYPRMCFLKEVSFRLKRHTGIATTVEDIQAGMKAMKQKEQEKKETTGLVQQARIIVQANPPALRNVNIRPTPRAGTRKAEGSLEGHKNGVSFRFGGNESVDITYENTRYAIFHPADNDQIVCVHFHLHNPIMVGKKRCMDIQFSIDVLDAHENVGGRFRAEEDELAEEEQEKAQIRKWNSYVQFWTKKMEEQGLLKFQRPFRHREFTGTPSLSKSNINIRVTESLLVGLIETPFFVLPLEDVELCFMERVVLSHKNFDAVFIMKDYSKPVVRIDVIEMKLIEQVKDWLTERGIVIFEGQQPLVWPDILKVVQQDDRAGAWDPWGEEGWKSFLDVDHKADSESDSTTDWDDEAVSSSDSSEESGFVSEGDRTEVSSSDSEDSGVSWDELDRRLQLEDKTEGRGQSESDSEDSIPKRKRAAPKARPKGSRAPTAGRGGARTTPGRGGRGPPSGGGLARGGGGTLLPGRGRGIPPRPGGVQGRLGTTVPGGRVGIRPARPGMPGRGGVAGRPGPPPGAVRRPLPPGASPLPPAKRPRPGP